MAAIRPGNNERAWNDPPVFAFEGAQAQPPKRSVLSGRIRHPQPAPSPKPLGSLLPDSTPSPEGAPPEGHGPPISLLPPASTGDVPPIVPLAPTLTVTTTCAAGGEPDRLQSEETLLDPETLRTETMDSLEKVLKDCQGQMEERVETDVRRRLAVLSSGWSDGKLSQPVVVKMHKLAQALAQGDVDTAHSLHLSLMVDYVSEVSQWMVGIKRLIQEMRDRHSQKAEAPSDGQEKN